MADESSFADLMVRLRAGDQGAAADLFEHYAARLVALARRRLTAAIGTKEDPEDVVQSVFRTFFRRHNTGDFVARDWGSLWHLLTMITLRKCGHRVEYFFAERRNIAREAPPPGGDAAAGWEAIAREPTAEEAAILAETLESLLNSLDARRRRMVELALQGTGIEAIAEEVGSSERTVRRVLQLVRETLERLRDDRDAPP